MSEKIKSWVIVSPEAPEWMREVAKTLADAGEEAHGAILTICYDGRQTQLAQTVNVDDFVSAIANLCDLLREEFGGKIAEALIQYATEAETEEEA